ARGVRESGAFPRARDRRHGKPPRHRAAERHGGAADGNIQSRPGGDRRRRRRVPRPYHAHRPPELAKKKETRMKFETKVIHAGQQPDPQTGAVMTPIYATSTYAQSSPGEHKGFDYARTRNPTRDALEACLAELE